MTSVATTVLDHSTISPVTPPPLDHASPTWAEIPEIMSEAPPRFVSLDAAPSTSHPAFVPFTSDSTAGMYDHVSVDAGNPQLASGEIGMGGFYKPLMTDYMGLGIDTCCFG